MMKWTLKPSPFLGLPQGDAFVADDFNNADNRLISHFVVSKSMPFERPSSFVHEPSEYFPKTSEVRIFRCSIYAITSAREYRTDFPILQ
jgi:hypothetical protein